MRRIRQLFSSPIKAPTVPPVFAAPGGVRLYAVGDIHGRSKLLAKMLTAIEADARTSTSGKIIEVFLGDYVDRGMHTREVIDLLLAPPANGHERICLKGNHEEVLLRFLDDPRGLREWGSFGGYATLASYGIPIPASMSPAILAGVQGSLQKNLPTEHQAFLRNLRLTYQAGDYLFVHAGIHPKLPIHEQKSEHLLWIRDTFLNHTGFFDAYVVHGHSPHR